MRIDILTLFPDAVEASLKISILGRAEKKGILDIHAVQIRDYTENKQQQVDDYPYGGGWGCVMMAQPLKSCLDDVCAKAGEKRRRVIYMSPQGKTFDQSCARRLAADYDHLMLVCGHYEGVDERFIEECVDEEISLGDFVLTGGEIAAMAVTDAVCRLIPGVLADEECFTGESHWDGLLEYPQYTRPDVWEGREVPPILRSGVDREIARWRRKKMLERTMDKRPELFAKFVPQTDEDKALLDEIDAERHPRPVPPKIDCRRAEEADLPAILAIADEAKAFLAAQGLDQWQHGYPAEEDFRRDIERGDGWLFTADGNPAGYLCISRRSEAAYTAIEGEWLSCAGPYLTIHRIMVSDAYRGKGIASEMISLADDFAHAYCCAGVRIDTAPGNEPCAPCCAKTALRPAARSGSSAVWTMARCASRSKSWWNDESDRLPRHNGAFAAPRLPLFQIHGAELSDRRVGAAADRRGKRHHGSRRRTGDRSRRRLSHGGACENRGPRHGR